MLLPKFIKRGKKYSGSRLDGKEWKEFPKSVTWDERDDKHYHHTDRRGILTVKQ